MYFFWARTGITVLLLGLVWTVRIHSVNSHQNTVPDGHGQDSGSTPVADSYGQDSGSTPVADSYGQDSGNTPVADSYGQDSGSTPVADSYGQDFGNTPVVDSYGQDADTTLVPDSYGQDADTTLVLGKELAILDSLRHLLYMPAARSDILPAGFRRKRSPLIEIETSADLLRTEMDSLGYYTVRRTILDIPSGYDRKMGFAEFSETGLRQATRRNWERLILEKRRQRDVRRGLLDFTLELPVGERSAFTTIFGRPEVNLRVTGSANMRVGASIRETEDPALPPDQQRRIDPTFNQNLRLNIQGSIGDKLTIRTDWDTERAFDFENRLSIRYDGYDDEIIQSIQMGNVSMQTGNTLVRGGSALFGIKTEARLGPLTLTSVISQQEGQGNTQTISGGAQESAFEIRPAAYDNDRHFFLDFYSRQEFESSMSDPRVGRRLFNISRMEVYVLNTSSQERPGQRRAAALVDLGVVELGDRYAMPDPAGDRFDEELLNAFRNPEITPSASDFGVQGDEFVEGNFVPLQEGIDFSFNENSGFLSLETRLGPNQALAIAFSYINNQGQIVDVGDLNVGDERRMFLKLLRPSNITPASRAWNLTMRNVYNLSATNITRDDLEVEILYDGGNTPQTNLPGLNNILLQDLGLDRVNSQGDLQPDNQIDFGTGTLDAMRGRIIFPYLEPFGQRIVDIYESSSLPLAQIEENIERYAFTDLYLNTQENARQRSGNNVFLINGISTGSVQDSYNLGFALVEGSVRVEANGVELTEGVDYEVDYSIGNILITNDRYLQSGQEIVIDYESNQMMQIQQTTFTGLRAEYRVSENIQLGSTYFSLRERPLQDKIPVGDEPINNSILGFDGSADFDTPFLTRAINWLPLIQTRADSQFRISGEFAQLRPNIAQTRAVSRAMDRGELYSDEERGLSFIDDFEGSKTSINFLSPGRWHLAAAPHALPGYDLDMNLYDNSIDSRVARSDLRGKFSWYMIPVNISRITDAARTPESLPISVSDVFPNREVMRQEDRLQTLDIHFNPRKRGPYNYHPELRNLLENRPQDTWGGMTATLPSGLDNLRQNNIEFLEFWIQPILPDGRTPSGTDIPDYDGKIYIDLGLVSEDVIPNNVLNTEDGLARAQDRDRLSIDTPGRSYVIRSGGDLTGQFSIETQEREDVGLDGVHSTQGAISEQTLFADWLALMETMWADQPEEWEKIRNDPSNDRYYYFNDPLLSDLPLHERFHRMHGFLEGNSLTRGESRAVTNRPDTEGLINPASVNRDDSFFQYEIPLNPADTTTMQIGKNFIVDKVEGSLPTDRWYLVRLPLREVAREVGAIENLERVQHIRFWMSGYREPLTLRFATFELVGNQWRELEEMALEGHPNTIFEISTINIEENSNRQPIPYRIPNGAIRSIQRGQQENLLANEQSLSLRVEDLRSGEYRMIQRLYPAGLNLLNYSNLRMFVHGEGYERRSDIELVIRLGNDLNNNYYEYRQPVSPTDPAFAFTPLAQNPDASVLRNETDRIWIPDSNSVNLVLSSLNALKQARNLDGVDEDLLYERSDLVLDAPAGTIIAIKGNPSLERVREIGIGIRNPHHKSEAADKSQTYRVPASATSGRPSLDAEIWVNELRVSGFDDQKGWAANLRTDLRLADLATVRASLSRQTDGFGPLNASLGNRQMHDMYSYDLSTTFNMHRFIPERYGWSFPVQLSVRRRQQTPRFLPQQGDIRFTDFRDAVEASDLTSDQQQQEISQMLEQIRDQRQSYSVGVSNISKRNSQSPWLRHTIDNLTLGYVYNLSRESSPRIEHKTGWDHRSTFNYRLNVRNVNVVRPFLFLENIPVLRWISNTGFTYVPTSVGLGGNLNRRYSEEIRRSFTDQPFDLQQQHNFDFRSNVSVNYNFTQTISTSFSNQNQINLQNLGQRAVDPQDTLSTRFELIPTHRVLDQWLFDPSVNPRRDTYSESWSASWRPRLNQYNRFDWFNYSTSYRGEFRWQNSPEGSGLGANLSNSYNFEHNPEIRTQNLLRKLPLYRRTMEAHEQERRQRARRQNASESEDEGSGSLLHYARGLLLGALSLQNINVTYRRSGASGQGGYTGDSQIYYMFNDAGQTSYSPPFLYRIGLSDRINPEQLVRSPDPGTSLSLTATNRLQNQLNLRSGLRPVSDFSVNLDWRSSWDETTSRRMTVFYEDPPAEQFDRSGSISASVWAFGAGYSQLLKYQIDRISRHVGEETQIRDLKAGQIPLTAATLERDFRSAYLGMTDMRIGKRGFMPFPLPGWNVTWSGWEKRIGMFDRYIQRVSLNHGFDGRYRSGWQLNPNRGTEITRSLGGYTFFYEQPDFDPRSINLERTFSPLIGVSLSWVNNMRTQIQYRKSNRVSMSFSNNTITETNSRGVTSTLGYSKRGFRIPFFRQLNNQIELNLTVNYSEDLTLTYRMNEDIVDAIMLPPQDRASFVPAPPDERGQAQLQIRPNIRYQFSQTINMGFEYSYSRLMPRSSGTFPRTDQDIRFNIQVTIRSN